ncbi:MAG: hypothetical protein QMD08_03070 [Actinomycetota bacterium]|nr:hypothetical protein [Actinomycetota bacterium]
MGEENILFGIFLVGNYLVSLLVWGYIAWIFFFNWLSLRKKRPPEISASIAFALFVAALALTVESIYFGIGAYLRAFVSIPAALPLMKPRYWVLPKLLISLGGLFVLINLIRQRRKARNLREE